jgi:hypothetical protein
VSFIPFFSKPKRVYQNILAFRTLNTLIRAWVERDKDGPYDQEDYKEINAYVLANRQTIDLQAMIDTAEMLTKDFPRIVAVEVMNGSKTNGVIINRGSYDHYC